jgi:UDP-N-acetylmuramyl pentapeptide phosphotransferase/UDP-N-acetylglucosamine-1-phosphate transferase
VRGVRSAASGAGLAHAGLRALTARPPGGASRWQRANHRGRTLSLLSGPALVAAAAVTADLPRAAAAVAAGGAAAVGAYDDAVSARAPDVKGLRGHLRALRQGQVTSGAVKVVGLAAAGVAACALLEETPDRRRLLLGGAVVAGTANLLNLLDLRPGRALKAGAAAAVLLGQPGPAAAAAALLPGDLHEQTMLGDAGANGLGALLGLALLQRAPEQRGPALGVLLALTAASEVVSFSRVIDGVPVLRWVDRTGRRP